MKKKLEIQKSMKQFLSTNSATIISIEDIRNDVENYIKLRNVAIDNDNLRNKNITSNTISSKDYVKYDSPLEMFRARGWYRNEPRLELLSRSDKTIPIYSHPLAFAELEKYGM